MKSCFAHTYTIPFETLFQNNKNEPDSIEIHVESKIEIRGECIHKAVDFPGGPVLEIFEENKIFFLKYAQFQARLLENRIDLCGPIGDLVRVTQILERVILPVHLQLRSPSLVPLHGGAILFNEFAYVFIGDSGAGKSTTVLELVKRGAKVISDDLVFIDVNSMRILPGLPTLRLLEPTDIATKRIERVGPNVDKWWHLLEQTQLHDPLPIHSLFILKPGEDLFSIQPTQGFSKVGELLSQTFGLTCAGDVREEARFDGVIELARQVPVQYLHFRKGDLRPIHIDKLASYLGRS